MPVVDSRLYRDNRTLVIYTDREKKIMKLEVRVLNSQIEMNHEKNVSTIFLQQENIGMRVQAAFATKPQKVINVLVIAKTQSGKTGAMISICKEYTGEHFIPVENIYMITGHSSTAWKKQTKIRFPYIL